MTPRQLVKKYLPYKNREDWCSFWPDGCWGACCEQHDDDYKYGEVSKNEADLYLKECVTAAGHPDVAEWMYIGVSIFGWVAWFNHRRRNLKRE